MSKPKIRITLVDRIGKCGCHRGHKIPATINPLMHLPSVTARKRRLTSPCVVVCIPLKLILQDRRLFVCALLFLFVRTQSGRMVDCHVHSGAESPQDSARPSAYISAGYFPAEGKMGRNLVDIHRKIQHWS